MPRPETAQDVLTLVRQSGLVGDQELAHVQTRLPGDATPSGVFSVLVADGLLTAYQAEELNVGRWGGFWLGGYKVLDRLGKGGMGSVYLAEHAVLKKRVAVKVLSAGLRADPGARRRFVREARAAATVDHPNVVHVSDVDMDHDPPFLVMEYVDGVSVQAAVARTGTFSAAEAAAVGAEVARGLAAAHAAGLVHRDVKPANLLIDRRGGVKILDLGIVRLTGDDTQPRSDGSDVILGTLDYLAPEQAFDSAGVDARADLYALGATLYFALAGHPPFPGSDIRHKLAAKQYSDPPPIHRLRPDVDPDLSGVIQTLLARDPAARYQSAAAAADALAALASPGKDFPARLFRADRPSTADTPASPPPAPLPRTQRILRPAPRTPPPPPTATRQSSQDGDPTDQLMKAATDLSLTPLPPPLVSPPGAATPPRPRPRRRDRRTVIAWVVGAIAVLAAAVVILKRI